MGSGSDNTISVVIPCYNGMPYLSAALDSALGQTHRPAEVIVVDDGSTDDSKACVQEYIDHHPDRGIRLIEQANAGEPAARNTGIKAATGTWVAMLDTDDWWDPSKLAKQLRVAELAGPQCVMVHTGVVHEFDNGRSEPKDLVAPSRRVGRCTAALLEPSSIGHPSIMVRREALEKIGGYDPSFVQACDIDLYFRLSAVGIFAFVPEHLLHYRIHSGQMSASKIKQIRYHHRAVRGFFDRHPEIAAEVGRDTVDAALADHVAVKLESFYWQRRLGDFRALLEYAQAEGIQSPRIDAWQRRARWPDWLIRLKDRLGGSADRPAARGDAPQPAATEQPTPPAPAHAAPAHREKQETPSWT